MARGQRRSVRQPRATRATAGDSHANIYNAMLAEAETGNEDESGRPSKRRLKLSDGTPKKVEPSGNLAQPVNGGQDNLSSVPPSPARPQQYIDASDSSSNCEDSDLEFEDIDINQAQTTDRQSEHVADNEIADVSIAVGNEITPTKRSVAQRKTATPAEKAHRLLVHKLHVLCLIGHIIYRNSWCNDKAVQAKLRGFPDPEVVHWLTLGPEKSQFERNRWFLKGLDELALSFRTKFRVTASGLQKARWIESDELTHHDNTELLDRDLFIKSAKSLTGSQDTGNALFCAMLRSIGVEARLVCSLQPLPFDTASVNKGASQRKTATPESNSASYGNNASPSSKSASNTPLSSDPFSALSVRRRLGQPSLTSASPKPLRRKLDRPIQKLSYPVYWVEVFNVAHQKWLPIDPIVTQTVNQVQKLEPPVSYALNQLSYVIALERDGSGRDVTRRYAKAYNAKTRRLRVDSTDEGHAWWKRTMRCFRRSTLKRDREQVEDAELAQKAAKEGFPRNVQDFKGHPVYALERHLKRHEVLHPRRSVGRVNVAGNANPIMEEVFRRQDVIVCHSADKWYRLGRELKEHEQPVKHVNARPRPRRLDDDNENDTAQATRALYAYTQTRPYVAPSVVRGKVPRNAYGNLDIYVPSMVPAGGVHIRHELAQQAARLLQIDYADAVTGFQFKSRRGVAIIEGVVVASEFGDAMWTAIAGFQQVQEEDQSMARSLAALRMWKRFLTVLRVRERISTYADLHDTSDDGVMPDMEETASQVVESAAMPTAGRYTVAELGLATKPVKKRKRLVRADSEEMETNAENELPTEEYGAPTATASDAGSFAGGFLVGSPANNVDDFGGGFLADDDDGAENRSEAHDRVENRDDAHDVVMNEDKVAYEEGGGGFLVDSDQEGEVDTSVVDLQPTRESGSNYHQTVDDPTKDDTADGADNMEVASSASIPSTQVQSEASQQTQDLHDTTHVGTDASDDGNVVQQGDSDSIHDAGHAVTSDSDHGSMLSHDPEDDDAEPDWFESD